MPRSNSEMLHLGSRLKETCANPEPITATGRQTADDTRHAMQLASAWSHSTATGQAAVASEVRTLCRRSALAAQEIRALIQGWLRPVKSVLDPSWMRFVLLPTDRQPIWPKGEWNMRWTLMHVCLLNLAFASAGSGTAQDLPPAALPDATTATISTERPTVGDSPDVIPAGSLQIENGVGWSGQKSRYIVDLPESLVRYGTSDRVEVRFLTSNLLYQSQPPAASGAFQSADVVVSAKLLIAGPNTFAPKSAILSLSMPTGGPSFTSGSYDPALTAIWTQSFPHGYFINELAGASLTTLGGARRAAWSPSIAFGRPFTSSLTAFGEYAPTMLPGSSAAHVLDCGFALTRRTVQQFDFRAGYLKDTEGSHMLLSVGYSVRRDNFLGNFSGKSR